MSPQVPRDNHQNHQLFAGQEQGQAWPGNVESICLMRPMKESAKLTHTGAMDPLPYFRIQYVLLR